MIDSPANVSNGTTALDAAALLDALKRVRGSRRGGSVDRLPWYLLIGPPGAGKTSALLNSGLQFSLADENADQSVAGAPTTTYQYWFAEEAVLVDSSGRALVPTSGGEADKAAWTGFLRLLKRYRPRRPLNGVIAMVGLEGLANATSDERRQLARAIRGRLRELDDATGLRAPVYVVLTKVDRLAGFSAFFDALTPSARNQVWGFTLPLAEDEAEDVDLPARFATAFDRLAERLDAMLPARLREEADLERRNQAFAFPRTFALLAPLLAELFGEIGASSRADPPLRLRGFYFTSARQGGPSIDPLAGAVSARFGLDLPSLESRQSGAGSYFLMRLFLDVIFREENLVSIGPQNAPGRRRLRQIFGAIAAATGIALALFWWFAYSDQQRLLADAQTRLAAYTVAAQNIPTRDVADADLARAEQALDQVRNPMEASSGYRWAGPLSFDQSGKLLSAQGDLYGRALELILLPRILVGLQEAMQSSRRTPKEEDGDAKAYLMLGGRLPMDQDFARAALASLFDRLAPGAERQALRQALNDDATSLLRRPLAGLALDEALAEDAKARITTPVPP
jgi:type VI secretion system protein ImpL